MDLGDLGNQHPIGSVAVTYRDLATAPPLASALIEQSAPIECDNIGYCEVDLP